MKINLSPSKRMPQQVVLLMKTIMISRGVHFKSFGKVLVSRDFSSKGENNMIRLQPCLQYLKPEETMRTITHSHCTPPPK